jgi:hypothetical protein
MFGLVLFHKILNFEYYVTWVMSPFFAHLTSEEKCYGLIVQDNSRTHIANNPMFALDEVISERVISPRLWPPRSLDLIACDFGLCSLGRKQRMRTVRILWKVFKETGLKFPSFTCLDTHHEVRLAYRQRFGTSTLLYKVSYTTEPVT